MASDWDETATEMTDPRLELPCEWHHNYLAYAIPESVQTSSKDKAAPYA